MPVELVSPEEVYGARNTATRPAAASACERLALLRDRLHFGTSRVCNVLLCARCARSASDVPESARPEGVSDFYVWRIQRDIRKLDVAIDRARARLEEAHSTAIRADDDQEEYKSKALDDDWSAYLVEQGEHCGQEGDHGTQGEAHVRFHKDKSVAWRACALQAQLLRDAVRKEADKVSGEVKNLEAKRDSIQQALSKRNGLSGYGNRGFAG